MEKTQTFAEYLKQQRKRLGLTQSEFAVFLGVSPRAIWQWEKGKPPLKLTQDGARLRIDNAAKSINQIKA